MMAWTAAATVLTWLRLLLLLVVSTSPADGASCGRSYTTNSGTITSPNYPNQYYNNADCSWSITVGSGGIISLRFTDFHLEQGYDYVRVYNGRNTGATLLGQYTGGPKSISGIRSTGNTMYIRFTTDRSVLRKGFRATYDSQYYCNHQSYYASSGTITSPGYPNEYFNNADCSWSITVGTGRRISLRFTDFHLEGCCDYVKVYDGRNTGATLLGQYNGGPKSISAIRSTGNTMYIRFTTDGSVLRKGFRASYDSQYYCRHQSYTASSGTITSPGYPSGYYNNAYCTWSITVGTGRLISFRFTDFYLESSRDYVNVYDGSNTWATLLGRYTGESRSINVIQSTGNTMYIVFTTNGSVLKKGFRATYVSHYCSQSLTASSGTITSPGYPNQYFNNADCSWSITVSQGLVISFRFSDFQLERGYDYVKVYDGSNKWTTLLGQYTGELQSNVIRSKGNNMYIVFTSDGSVLRKGFRATYVSHYCQEFHYGEQNCNTRCPCERSNTVYCNNINGTCLCKDGWTGNTCTVNVNECLGTNVDLCPENSNCVDTVGSYTCVCSPGYLFNVATRECDVRNECSAKQCSHSCIITDREEEQCVCPADLVIDRAENLTCVVPYYPYGTMYGDHNVQSEGEEEIYNFVSAPIKFSPGVPFGTKEQSFASVRTSGVISFGERPVPLQPDLKDAVSSRQNIIVPFWALMSKDKGRTYYQLYEKWSETGSTSSSKDMVMKRAKEDIIKFYNLHGFEVNTVLLATWDAVEPLGSQGDEQNTFQGIYVSGWKKDMKFGREILSDEQTGYVIFLYQKGMMKWKHVEGRIVEVGTTHSGQIQTRTEMLGDLAGNTGYNGVLTFEIGRVGGDRQKCHKYVSSHAELLSDPAYEAERNGLYNCPCTLERLGRQWQLFEIRGENRDIYCYAISILAKRRLLQGNTRNKLCCYKWVRPVSQSWYVWTWWIDWILAWRQAPFVNGHVLIGDPWYFWWQRNNNVGYLQARENIQAQQWCCSDVYSTELCERFYSIFPRQECTNHVTFVTGAALGDPHITTLDGLTYTMNGLGEYFMLDIPTENFTLQARTGRAESSNGTLTNATVFTAFAAKESNYSTFQVELSTTNTTMVIIADGIDLTSEFYDDFEFERTTETISVARQLNQNKTVVVATFPCGVTMKTSVGVKSLLIEFELDETLQNKTTGLLGNFNGNMDDEFTLPNGTVLTSNISDREIFYHFGKSWEVTAENSVFTYEAGVNATDYQHPDFVPMFRDEADPEAVAEAEEVCGTENDACIFDYLVTGDTAFAEDTKLSKENYDVQRINLENNPPTIELRSDNVNNSNLIIHNGTETKIHYVIDDADDNDTVELEFVTNSNIASVDESGTITTVTFGPYVYDGSHALEMFGVRAVDSKGGSSQVIYTPVFLCTGCSRHGQCSNTTVREKKPGDSFFKLACNCLPAYTGDDCESEVDACKSKPCFQGQSCTDLTAAEQGNSSIGYTCGPCPAGFTEQNGQCIDIDECSTNNTCEQMCTNTEGSYSCGCYEGYRLDPENKHNCSDIDECGGNLHNCEGYCNNEPGNYSCRCWDDYILGDDGHRCIQNFSTGHVCLQKKCDQKCEAVDGQATCDCANGYEKDPENETKCLDVNECELDNMPCCQVCNNTVGSYSCSCYPGYTLDVDKVSCSLCEVPYYGENCANICQCSGHGTCDPIRGCVCDEAWTGTNCEADVDECTNSSACPVGHLCENEIGSYSCLCSEGYQKTDTGTCEDINECTSLEANMTCDLNIETCENTVGSYRCLCKNGYVLDKTICTDINECASGDHECDQVCQNVPGSYKCLCNPGYKLAADRCSCVQIKNFCLNSQLNCSHICSVNASGQLYCACPRGYQLRGSTICEDVDLCATASCSDGCIETNENRSFQCVCRPGRQLEEDLITCSDCPDGKWGMECLNQCQCVETNTDSCNKANGSCTCKTGWKGDTCSVEIDVCEEVTCQEHSFCNKTDGGHVCICDDGYFSLGSITKCEECEAFKFGYNCSQSCECNRTTTDYCNATDGSCVCNNGWEGQDCSQDVDECVDDDLCTDHSTCHNVDGSYTCLCIQGFIWVEKSRICQDVDECASSPCEQTCTNYVGSFECSCEPGYTFNETNSNMCQDVNECSSSPCEQICTNSEGSFECSCQPGYTVNETNSNMCQECEAFKFGYNCSQSCECNRTTTDYCNATNGSCVCNNGWEGQDCSQDVDECVEDDACPDHSTCQNEDGSYTCLCDQGYSWVEDSRICQDINECSSSPCEQICTNSEGSFECSCQSGYIVDETNSNMCQDVNECASSPCEQICTNNEGSFDCSCETGYAVDNTNSNMCQDVNECSSSPCDQICTNNEGSFECSCQPGYIIDETNSNMCQDVNECSSSPCEQICTNNEGSFECSCEPGYTVDDTNSNMCQDVNECSSSLCEQICTNSVGSFECSCQPGFAVDETNSNMCQDVDECSSSPCEQICTNNVGSFECSCQPGYTVDETNSDHCQDVDECADDENSPCEQNCTNTDGSFDCSCRTGFMKNQADPSQCFETSVYNMTLVFGYEETVDFSNENTDDYRNIKSEIEIMVETKLEKKGLPVVAANVISLREGSVDATLEVVMNKEEEQANTTDAFTDAMIGMMFEDRPSINGTASPLRQFSVNDQEYSDTDTPCDIRQKRNPCAESETCVEGEDRETVCWAAEDSNETDLILALALGIPCLLILCALITVLVYCNAKNQNKKEAEPSPPASENMSYKLNRDFAVDKGGKFGSSNPFYFESKYQGSDKHGSLWRQGHGLPEGVSRNPRPDYD